MNVLRDFKTYALPQFIHKMWECSEAYTMEQSLLCGRLVMPNTLAIFELGDPQTMIQTLCNTGSFNILQLRMKHDSYSMILAPSTFPSLSILLSSIPDLVGAKLPWWKIDYRDQFWHHICVEVQKPRLVGLSLNLDSKALTLHHVMWFPYLCWP